MAHKDERLASVIRELASQFINEESNRQSIITITRVMILDRGKRVTIFFTALPEDSEERALEFLSRKKSELRKFIGSKKIIGFTPKLEFARDFGEHNRQRIDELLNEG